MGDGEANRAHEDDRALPRHLREALENIGLSGATPPIARNITLSTDVEISFSDSDTIFDEPNIEDDDSQSISSFLCVIEYGGATRLISCRRFELIGDIGYLGAICLNASGYRCFRCDRIESVADPYTGEVLGTGAYFHQFSPWSVRERAPTWGLSPARRALLVAGLNVLAFMARCDGQWHPLETEPIEQFICSLWLRKEWEGEPPLAEIMAHAARLSPDREQFYRSLKSFKSSRTSRQILQRTVGDLIAADGVAHKSEVDWAIEIASYFAGSSCL